MTKINMFTNELSFNKGAITARIEPHRCSKVDWYQLCYARPRQSTRRWTAMTPTLLIIIMGYCLARRDVVINLLPRRVAPSTPLMVLNWRSVASANKDRFDNVQSETNAVCRELINTSPGPPLRWRRLWWLQRMEMLSVFGLYGPFVSISWWKWKSLRWFHQLLHHKQGLQLSERWWFSSLDDLSSRLLG